MNSERGGRDKTLKQLHKLLFLISLFSDQSSPKGNKANSQKC